MGTRRPRHCSTSGSAASRGRCRGACSGCSPPPSEEMGVDELADLPIGRRDAHLLGLRERLFGPDVTVVAGCPACGEQIESAFSIDALRIADADGVETAHAAEIDGYRAVFRLPTTRDLLTLTEAESARCDPPRALRRNSRCGRRARANGVVELGDTGGHRGQDQRRGSAGRRRARAGLPVLRSSVVRGLRYRELSLEELHAWALRTLREVHTLARSYGWREADVLALSGTRRQLYLELCGQ